VLDALDLEPKGYFLVTIHRAENVDVADRLRSIAVALARLSVEHGVPVVVSTHPHTRKRLADHEVRISDGDVRFVEPFGLFDFVWLERNARCVLTDSGTVQEECSIFGVPNVTVRDVTERPETLECGSNMLSGADPDLILAAVRTVLAKAPAWQPPPEYLVPDVSDKVVRLVLGYHHPFRIRGIL
jgi:UDP-N-acetylglucosamine 2-epimerase (non-hydrolysing)